MKNLLNEEINKMKYLLNYNRGLTLTEQKNVINEDAAPGGLGGDWNPSTGEYTIVKGDTLSKIGKAFGVKWMDIWEENKDTLRSGKPNCGKYCGYNWIFVGEVVTIPGKAETTKAQDDTTVDDTTATTDTTATETPAVVPVKTTVDDEPKTKKEIKRDCRAEANQQELKRFTKERREFMRNCKAQGGVNAESDEENTPAEDKQTGSERRQIRRNCRAEAKQLNKKGKAKRDHIRKCKAEGGEEGSETSVINSTTANQPLGNAPQEVTQYFEQLQTTDPYDILVSSKSDDREVAFKKAREDAQTQLGINYEPTLVGTRKVTSSSDGYNVYAAFKK
jgi:hypothetical protein